jgi:hypothetical protein
MNFPYMRSPKVKNSVLSLFYVNTCIFFKLLVSLIYSYFIWELCAHNTDSEGVNFFSVGHRQSK